MRGFRFSTKSLLMAVTYFALLVPCILYADQPWTAILLFTISVGFSVTALYLSYRP